MADRPPLDLDTATRVLREFVTDEADDVLGEAVLVALTRITALDRELVELRAIRARARWERQFAAAEDEQRVAKRILGEATP